MTTALGFVDAADARFPTMPVAVKRAVGPPWRETETLRVVYAETGDMTTLVAPDAGSVSVDASLSHGSSPSIDRQRWQRSNGHSFTRARARARPTPSHTPTRAGCYRTEDCADAERVAFRIIPAAAFCRRTVGTQEESARS